MITDIEGNDHIIYSFGFDREGNYGTGKFSNDFDVKIKTTIIHIIKEFFNKNGDKAIMYFCYDDDGLPDTGVFYLANGTTNTIVTYCI